MIRLEGRDDVGGFPMDVTRVSRDERASRRGSVEMRHLFTLILKLRIDRAWCRHYFRGARVYDICAFFVGVT